MAGERISSTAAPPYPVFHNPKSVLVVDDNQVNREIVTLQLRKMGLNTITVESGNETVELLRSHPDDFALVLDVQMPDTDGLAATRLVRQHEANTNRHILVPYSAP